MQGRAVRPHLLASVPALDGRVRAAENLSSWIGTVYSTCNGITGGAQAAQEEED